MYFSSSPGLLTSVDDFYTVFSRGTYSDNLYQNEVYKYPERGRFAVVETSLDVYNVEALALIEPNSLLSWCRVRAANLMAIDGDDWSKIFSYEHSGTYSNQWMIIDFSKLYDFPVIGAQQPTISGNTGESASWIGPGLLTVLEEMPGLIQYEDMTSKLLVCKDIDIVDVTGAAIAYGRLVLIYPQLHFLFEYICVYVYMCICVFVCRRRATGLPITFPISPALPTTPVPLQPARHKKKPYAISKRAYCRCQTITIQISIEISMFD